METLKNRVREQVHLEASESEVKRTRTQGGCDCTPPLYGALVEANAVPLRVYILHLRSDLRLELWGRGVVRICLRLSRHPSSSGSRLGLRSLRRASEEAGEPAHVTVKSRGWTAFDVLGLKVVQAKSVSRLVY